MSKHAFPQKNRLKHQSQFDSFFSSAKKIHTPYCIIYIAEKQEPDRLFAFIANKKTGNAVARNRSKRRLRELIRQHQHYINKRFDIAFIAKEELLTAKKDTIESCLITCFKENAFKFSPNNNY